MTSLVSLWIDSTSSQTNDHYNNGDVISWFVDGQYLFTEEVPVVITALLISLVSLYLITEVGSHYSASDLISQFVDGQYLMVEALMTSLVSLWMESTLPHI